MELSAYSTLYWEGGNLCFREARDLTSALREPHSWIMLPLFQALWVHRRFLFQFWLNYLSTDSYFNSSNPGNYPAVLDVADFLQKELQLLLTCLSSPVDEFEDGRVQSEHASSYFFWILKVCECPQSIFSHMKEARLYLMISPMYLFNYLVIHSFSLPNSQAAYSIRPA